MRLRHWCIAGTMLFGVSALVPVVHAQDNPCDIALNKAANDELHVQNDKAFDLKVITAVKQTDWSKATEKVNADGSVDVAIFSLGGDYEREQMQEIQKYYEQTGSKELRAYDRSFLKKRTA